MLKISVNSKYWVNAGFFLFSLLFTLFLLSCESPSSLYNLSDCECDDTIYILTLVGNGSFTCLPAGEEVPDQPHKKKYKKGTVVIVAFTPSSDKIFTHWECSPPSHLAHECDSQATFVWITGQTTLEAKTEQKEQILSIHWFSSYGEVELVNSEEGEFEFECSEWWVQNPSCSGMIPFEYGDIITLRAKPDEGCYTVWGLNSYTQLGLRYNDTIKVKQSGFVTATFFPGDPGEMFERNIILLQGSADIFSSITQYSGGAGSAGVHSDAGIYLSPPYTIGPVSLWGTSINIVPHKGYAFNFLMGHQYQNNSLW